jgi:hypothetical protein
MSEARLSKTKFNSGIIASSIIQAQSNIKNLTTVLDFFHGIPEHH